MRKFNVIKPSKEIETCPFCGSTVDDSHDSWRDADNGSQRHESVFTCDCGVQVRISKPLEQAMETWNQREGYNLPSVFKDATGIVWCECWCEEVQKWGYVNGVNDDWIDKNRAFKLMLDFLAKSNEDKQ